MQKCPYPMNTGLKISVNIKTYILSRAKLLCTLCHEIPCMIISELSTSLNLYIIYTLISLIFPFSNLKHSGICYFGPLYNTIHVSHFVAVQNNYIFFNSVPKSICTQYFSS